MEDDPNLHLDDELELPGGDNPLPHKTTKRKGTKTKKVVVVLVAFIFLGLIGFGAWTLLKNKPEDAQKSTNSTDKSGQQDNSSSTGNSTGNEDFTSSTLRLGFSYPSDWKVTENYGGIRVESPELKFVDIGGKEVSGNFRVYIRKGARDDDSKYIGRGIAIKTSEKLVYAKPTSTQRKETFLSFFGLDSSDNFSYFLVAGNYELKKDETLGPDYGKEAETIIVAGGYSSKELTDDLATHKMPLGSYATTDVYKQAVEIIKSLEIT